MFAQELPEDVVFALAIMEHAPDEWVVVATGQQQHSKTEIAASLRRVAEDLEKAAVAEKASQN